jgi:hypothetical protein
MPTLPNQFNTRQLIEVAEFITIIDDGSSYAVDYVHRHNVEKDFFDLRVDKNAPPDMRWQVYDQDVVVSDTGTIECKAMVYTGDEVDITMAFSREVPMTPQDFGRLLEEQAVHDAVAAG